MGVARGALWLSGGVCFEHSGTVFLNFGCRSSGDGVEGLTEILASEYESARQTVLNQRKAA